MKVAAALLVAGFTALAGAAEAQDWRVTSRSPTFVHGMDFARITDVGGLKRVWTIRSNRRAESDGTIYNLINYEIDCRRRTLTSLGFSDHATSGRTTFQETLRRETMAIPPGSNADDWRRAACEGFVPRELSHDGARGFHLWAQGWFSRQ